MYNFLEALCLRRHDLSTLPLDETVGGGGGSMDTARALGTQDIDGRRVPRTLFREGRRDFSNLHKVTQEKLK